MFKTYPREYLPVNSVASIVYSSDLSRRRMEVMTKTYDATKLALRKYKRGDNLSNNWLKMHGRPKRRKDWEEL